jgi:hypothetical protein
LSTFSASDRKMSTERRSQDVGRRITFGGRLRASQRATIPDSRAGVSDDWPPIAAAAFLRVHGLGFPGGFEEPEFLPTADE